MHLAAWCGRHALSVALLLLCGSASIDVIQAQSLVAKKIARGQKLFEKDWVRLDFETAGGDGLGPMHNATSCAACHRLGGMGGAGPAENNVDLLSVVPPQEFTRLSRAQLTKHLAEFHPGFLTGAGSPTTNIVLHRFGADADYETWRAELTRKTRDRDAEGAGPVIAALVRATAGRKEKEAPIRDLGRLHGMTLLLSQRNTPALFGAGLIDAIPGEEIVAAAEEQKRRSPRISGRVPRTGSGEVARFGWRGQIGTLTDFVIITCANELGLQNDGNPQAKNPLEPEYRLDDVDLNDYQCEDLAAFVADLPRPRELQPSTNQLRSMVAEGRRMFRNVGCAACHLPKLGPVEGIYSDLLLHDMGESLADPVAALPETTLVSKIVPVATYSGSSGMEVFEPLVIPSNTRQEWRTPPLWGLRDSAPYLHDGRCATVAEAIALHGGEAEESAKRFHLLPSQQRRSLLAFLDTLAAP